MPALRPPRRRAGRPARAAACAAAALVLLSGCAGTSGDAAGTPTTASGYHGVEPTPVPERPRFVLNSMTGGRYDFWKETAGKPTYVYFGYTDCPDECPTAMADIAAALRRADEDVRDDIRVVFVTTDPERDDPARLKEWLGQFGERFVGLYGTQDEVDTAQSAAGLRPAKRGGDIPTLPGKPNEHAHKPGTAPHSHTRPLGYSVEHANVIFAYDVDDRLPVLYPAGATAGDLVADLPKLADPPDRS